jgi:hypothetical protein
VTWLKKDVPVITSTRVVELSTNNKHTLLFRTVHPLDFGYFKCRATNELGANEKVIQLSGNWLSFFCFPGSGRHAINLLSESHLERLKVVLVLNEVSCHENVVLN